MNPPAYPKDASVSPGFRRDEADAVFLGIVMIDRETDADISSRFSCPPHSVITAMNPRFPLEKSIHTVYFK